MFFLGILNLGMLSYAKQFSILRFIVCLAYVSLFKVPDYRYEKTFNSNVAAKCKYIFNDFYWFINLVSLENAYNSIGLIKFKEKM